MIIKNKLKSSKNSKSLILKDIFTKMFKKQKYFNNIVYNYKVYFILKNKNLIT